MTPFSTRRALKARPERAPFEEPCRPLMTTTDGLSFEKADENRPLRTWPRCRGLQGILLSALHGEDGRHRSTPRDFVENLSGFMKIEVERGPEGAWSGKLGNWVTACPGGYLQPTRWYHASATQPPHRLGGLTQNVPMDNRRNRLHASYGIITGPRRMGHARPSSGSTRFRPSSIKAIRAGRPRRARRFSGPGTDNAQNRPPTRCANHHGMRRCPRITLRFSRRRGAQPGSAPSHPR